MKIIKINSNDLVVFSDFTFWIDEDLIEDKKDGNIVLKRKNDEKQYHCDSHTLYGLIDLVIKDDVEIRNDFDKKQMRKFVNLFFIRLVN